MSTPPPDARAEEIFFRMRVAFGARAFPSTMRYSIRISGLKDGAWTGRTYDAHEEWPDGSLFVDSTQPRGSGEPGAPDGHHPFRPRRPTEDGHGVTGNTRRSEAYDNVRVRLALASAQTSRSTTPDPVDDGTGTFAHVDVQFLNVVADPHENLDFGISSDADDKQVIEPRDIFR